jgi:hypothetical protein
MKKIACIIVSILLLAGCGASEKEEFEAINNSTNLGHLFFRNTPLAELYNGDVKTGYIIFGTDGATIAVDMCGIKDEKKIKKVIDKIKELAKKENIKNRILLTLYSKATQTGKGKTKSINYTSKDIFSKRKIQ